MIVLLCMQMPCVVDNSPMESSHAALTGNLRSIVASSAAQGSGTDTSERAAASEQAIASLQAEASDTDLATQTDMVHVKVCWLLLHSCPSSLFNLMHSLASALTRTCCKTSRRVSTCQVGLGTASLRAFYFWHLV